MIRWMIHKLASVLPPVIDADSTEMRFSTTQRRLFLKETRFLFFSQNGPIELALRPGHILASIGGGAGLAVFVFLSPGLLSVAALPSFTSLIPSALVEARNELSVPPRHATEQAQTIQTASGVSLPLMSRLITVFSADRAAEVAQTGPETAPTVPQSTDILPASRLAEPPLPPDTAVAVRAPTNFSTIEEPNDELITDSTLANRRFSLTSSVCTGGMPSPSKATNSGSIGSGAGRAAGRAMLICAEAVCRPAFSCSGIGPVISSSFGSSMVLKSAGSRR